MLLKSKKNNKNKDKHNDSDIQVENPDKHPAAVNSQSS